MGKTSSIVLAWVLTTASLASDVAPEGMEPAARTVVATLVTREGETLQGEIVGTNARAMSLRVEGLETPHTVAWASLPAETAFRLWRQSRGETDAARWIELARVLRAMHDGRELSESALAVATLLDATKNEEAEAVRQMPVPPPPAPGERVGWSGSAPRIGDAGEHPATWGDFPAEREPQYIAAVKAHAEDVAEKLGVTFITVETTHFLYFTNVPPEKTYHSPRLLDQMYDKACELYGLPRGTRLFKGKCPIFMFAEQGQLQRFTQMFGGPEWAAGFCQQSTNGDVQIVMYQGQDRGYTIQTMLHETAHGVNWRYRAPNFLPPWLEEGIAEWIASNTTGDFKYVKSKRWVGIQKARETKRLGGQFFAPPSDGSPGIRETWEYGLAYGMVDSLVQRDRDKFVAMVNAIKDGTPQDLAIEQHFGITLDGFITKFGEGIGVKELTR